MKRLLLLSLAAVLPLRAQHDPGRDAVRILAKGDAVKALEVAAKDPQKMNSPIDEAEKAFVRVMVACQQGKAEEAFAQAKEAIANGLQITRLQAGPRDMLKVLYDHKPYQQWMAGKQGTLVHGPMLGSVTDTSASFWVRTDKEAEVVITAWPALSKATGIEPVSATVKTSANKDFTAVARINGLKADSDCVYRVTVDGVVMGGDRVLRTFPKADAPSKFRVIFGGGAGYTPQYEHMWTTITERKPLSLLLLGDNVYIDDPEHQLTQHYCYYRRQSQPLWRNLVASTNVAAIYDDHDFGENDCNPGPKIDEPAWKRPVWETFRNNWVNPSYAGGDKQPGCWFDFTIGQVHFIMLDCRYYRDLEGGSMLGPVQKAWLMETLGNSKGVFKVIVSSVPWSPGVKAGSKDTWDGFPAEREEIFSTIEKEKISGVLLMSADRHRTDFRKIARPNGYDLYEVMSSRLTNVHTHPLVPKAKGSEFIMGYNEKCSFGQIDFDTTAEDPTLTYTIVSIDNEEVGKAELKLSQLDFRE